MLKESEDDLTQPFLKEFTTTSVYNDLRARMRDDMFLNDCVSKPLEQLIEEQGQFIGNFWHHLTPY